MLKDAEKKINEQYSTLPNKIRLPLMRTRTPPSSTHMWSYRPQTSSGNLAGAAMNTGRRRLQAALLAVSPSSFNLSLLRGTLSAPWSAGQRRGAKVLGTDVRNGNVIQRKGRIFQVLKAQHTQHGRGGATIQVELRDVDSGNKITERFRTDEAIERVFVQEKSYTYLYQEGDSVMIMEPETFDQLEVPKVLFGKSIAYLKEDMKITLQTYDGKPMSATVPSRVTCTVSEAQPTTKGQTATPQYKRVSLDNGLTILVPSFITSGDRVVINTIDDSYMTRAKE